MPDNFRKMSDIIDSNGYVVVENFIDENTIKKIKQELNDFNYFSVTNINN